METVNIYEHVLEARECVLQKLNGFTPKIGLVLGSGLSGVEQQMTVRAKLPSTDIPHLPRSTVHGHQGAFLFGTLAGQEVVISSGRVHFYEGYPLSKVTLAMRLMAALGCHSVVLTNAVGCLRDDLKPGDFVAVTDHINLMGANPLRGPHDERMGARFPDLSELYSPTLIQHALSVAEKQGVTLKTGVLTATAGPTYESPAEIQMIKLLGGDTVGMSTVPEAIVAGQAGMRVLAISCVTNFAAGLTDTPLTHEEVLEVSNRVSTNFENLILEILKTFPPCEE